MSSVDVFPPDTSADALSVGKFPFDSFMGKWHVIQSTLGMWRNKREVSITYEPIVGDSNVKGPRKFLDTVEFRFQKYPLSMKKFTVVGIDTDLENTSYDSLESPAGRFIWKMKSRVPLAPSSRWQVLGYGDNWAITYFEKTMFTEAGLDIYSREPSGLPDELLKEIIAKAQALEGEAGKLAKGLFAVMP